jgi:hypothetical protein
MEIFLYFLIIMEMSGPAGYKVPRNVGKFFIQMKTRHWETAFYNWWSAVTYMQLTPPVLGGKFRD